MVTGTLFVELSPGEVRAALVEDGVTVELWHERELGASLLGAVFLGRVVRVVPQMPGAFVDIGAEATKGRPAFLDGGAGLVEGQAILVQVLKDAHADKAVEVTRAISLPGRWAVWTPERPGIAVSRRIEPAERARLSSILARLVAPGEGVVLRSHAVGVTEDALVEDLAGLRATHRAMSDAATRTKAPARLDRPPSALERVLAGMPLGGLDRIVLDDAGALSVVRRLAANPSLAIEAERPGLFERSGIEAAIDAALESTVDLPGGGSLVIEATTALTAIDINLGAAAGGRGRAAEAILATNLAAAAAVARELRLRNLAGSIVVDFVSMRSREHRQRVQEALAAAVAADPVPVEILGWTRLGHLELTRKRGLPSLAETLLLTGPARASRTPLTVALAAARIVAQSSALPGRVELRVAPAVAALLEGRCAPFLADAARRAGRSVTLVTEPDRAPDSFDIAPRRPNLA